MENTNTKSNSGLKAAIVVLALLLLGSIGYIYKLTSDNKKQVTELSTEKAALEDDIKARIAELEAMSGENTALKGDIDAQKEEMTKLLEELEINDDFKIIKLFVHIGQEINLFVLLFSYNYVCKL